MNNLIFRHPKLAAQIQHIGYEKIVLFLLLIYLAIGLLYFRPFSASSPAVITISMQSDQANQLAVYWKNSKQAYSQQQVSQVETQAARHNYRLALAELANIQQIRIDPLNTPGKVSIEQIKILGYGYAPIVLNAANNFRGIDFSSYNNLSVKDKVLEFIATSNDDFFELNLALEDYDQQAAKTIYTALLQLFIVILAISFIIKLKMPDHYPSFSHINILVLLSIVSIMAVQLCWQNHLYITSEVFSLKLCFFMLALGFLVSFFYPAAQLCTLYFLIFCLLFYNLQAQSPQATARIELETPINSELAIYWANKDQAYQESHSAHIKTAPDSSLYELNIGGLKDLFNLRIDPIASPGRVLIKSITLSEWGFDPIRLDARNHFDALDIEHRPTLKFEGQYLVFDALTTDSYFELFLNDKALQANQLLYRCAFTLSALISICLLLMLLTRHYSQSFHYLSPTPIKKLGIILSLLLLAVLIFSLRFGFFIDWPTNEVQIINALEKIPCNTAGMPDREALQIFAHISFLDLSYAALLLFALIITSVFFPFKVGLFLLSCSLLCLGIGYCFQHQATLISIEMDANVEGKLRVYWADNFKIYQEKHSSGIKTQAGRHIYNLEISNLNNIYNLRIDPFYKQGKIRISSITIKEQGYQGIILNAQNHFFALNPLLKSKKNSQFNGTRLLIEQDNLIVNAVDEDNFFELTLDQAAFKTAYPLSFYLNFCALLLCVWVFFYLTSEKFALTDNKAVFVTLRVGFCLVVLMVIQLAWQSAYNVHPDEKAHIDSIAYYTQYWDPPVIGDSRSLDSYQYPWGLSRLDDLGISYLLMGKLQNIFAWFSSNANFNARAFNSVLIFLLLLLNRNKPFALFMLPLLCLPQVWYLFGYANRDAFALSLSLLLGWQLVNKQSSLWRYLSNPSKTLQWSLLLLPASLIGILSIELTNYLLCILYFIAILCWHGLFFSTKRLQFALRCLILLLAAGSIFGARKAVDIYINGFDKQEQKMAFAEAHAAPDFRPSVATSNEGYFKLRLRQKGEPALALFSPKWEWQVFTFKSFVGLYGNERDDEYSAHWYYSYQAYLYAVISITLLIAAIFFSNMQTAVLTLISLIFLLGGLFESFLYSWLYDFQPQGRYTFQCIPITMIYLSMTAKTWPPKIKALLLSCALLLFVLGLYSFRTIALGYLAG